MGLILAPIALGFLCLTVPGILFLVLGLRIAGTWQRGLVMTVVAAGCCGTLGLVVPFVLAWGSNVSWELVFQVLLGGGGLSALAGIALTFAFLRQRKPWQAYTASGCFFGGALLPIGWFALGESLMSLFNLTFNY